MSRLKYKSMSSNNIDKDKIYGHILRVILLLIIIIVIWAQNNYVVASKYVFDVQNIEKSLVGFRVVHISDICNTNNKIYSKVKKAKPDIILVTGGYKDKSGKSNRTVKLINKLSKIADVYYIYNTDDDGDELEGTNATNITDTALEIPNTALSVEDFIKKNYGDKIIKSANKGDNESVQYMQYVSDELNKTAGASITLVGMPNMKDATESEIKNKALDLCGGDQDNLIILLSGNLLNINSIALSTPDIILSGGTFGTKSDKTACTKGLYSYHGTELFLSGGCGNYDKQRVLNLPEFQLIILSDGTIKQYNPVEELLKKLIGDVGTIYDNDGGFKPHSYSGEELSNM